ncbi:hypothetical protein L7F22_067545 [Adiantum nelumboides]|nr:hypothetical protein [Adiantum nelumboides]
MVATQRAKTSVDTGAETSVHTSPHQRNSPLKCGEGNYRIRKWSRASTAIDIESDSDSKMHKRGVTEKSFEVYCDACGRSLGAVLMQEGRVIASESHPQSLRYFLLQKQFSKKQMRWANILSQFHFRIVHVQGQKNVVTDALSRKPLVWAISAIHHSTFEDMVDQYATDTDFVDIFTRIRDGETCTIKLIPSLQLIPPCFETQEYSLCLFTLSVQVEIGNYDSFYLRENRIFSTEEIMDLTRQTRSLLPSTVLSVTVPHTLSLDEQVKLAEMLEDEGVDIIQTEGGTSSSPMKPGVHGLMEKAAPTLAAAYSISKVVQIPVLCASGLSDVTAPLALAAGAAGVGVGSAINKLDNEVAMIASVRSIADALGLAFRASVQRVDSIGFSRIW